MNRAVMIAHFNLRQKLLRAKVRDQFKEVLHYFVLVDLQDHIYEVDLLFTRDQPKDRSHFIDLICELINEGYPVEFNNSYSKIRYTGIP